MSMWKVYYIEETNGQCFSGVKDVSARSMGAARNEIEKDNVSVMLVEPSKPNRQMKNNPSRPDPS
jgi:hypothetical protein